MNKMYAVVIEINPSPITFTNKRMKRTRVIEYNYNHTFKTWDSNEGTYIPDIKQDASLPDIILENHIHMYFFEQESLATLFLSGVNAGILSIVRSALNLNDA